MPELTKLQQAKRNLALAQLEEAKEKLNSLNFDDDPKKMIDELHGIRGLCSHVISYKEKEMKP